MGEDTFILIPTGLDALYLRNINLSIWFLGSTSDFSIQLKFKPLLLENTLEVLRDFHIDAQPTNVAQEFHSGHVCT